jgi:hypothetical protein
MGGMAKVAFRAGLDEKDTPHSTRGQIDRDIVWGKVSFQPEGSRFFKHDIKDC